ncbi:HtrA protease/chaperone protein [Cystobacter fuscus DSM 2262]|uniref:HtrA protease/chaperone protein n=1 Tax=Cystobacter fuscus (strain ATCC 25194 / DSM 2262 / NBRC 100088 / M29) TaxID=1242864 RepID=S9P212_CYSF2|nr:Do family serine endopeptidase [Cystobacter fuscus]EPX58505.1 HtrA protease/chaperone protein [Cystobacter fuscus DSM 2262]
MTHARPAFWFRLFLFNALLLSVSTGCERRAREPALPPPPAVSQAPAPAPDAPRPVQQGAQPARPLPQEEQATGGSGQLVSVADLVEAVKSSVVNVDVQVRAPGLEAHGDLLERFFGMPGLPEDGPAPRERVQQGEGSGFIIDPNGLILTNNHVVENAFSIRVRLDDGREYEAKVLGRDPLTDLALIKLQGNVKDLPFVRLGDSDAVRVGDPVVAIGNPFGLTSSVSSGILSARARDIQAGPYDNFLQTDAAINPGNSGGPLFNARGEVIGINTAIVGGGAGIGFAVPSNTAQALLPQLQKGKIRRGWLGVSVQDLTPDLARALKVPQDKGAIVTGVQENTPSARAGLQQDDIITAVNGEPVESARALTRDIGFRPPEETVKLTVYHAGQSREVRVKLAERPDLEGFSTQPPGDEREESGRRLGMRLQDVDPRLVPGAIRGALIIEVEPGSPAERAGLQPGMVIVEAGGRPVNNPREFAQAVRGQAPGSVLLLRIQLGESRLLRALTIPEER